MTSLHEAAQAALDALVRIRAGSGFLGVIAQQDADKAITVLREVLRGDCAADPARPVAFVRKWDCGKLDVYCAKLGQTFNPDQPLYTADAIRAAVEAEREACAKVCEMQAERWKDDRARYTANECASAIRARGAA